MNLTWHQLKRDLRAGSALLALWWGLLLLYVLTGLPSVTRNVFVIDQPDRAGMLAELIGGGWWIAGLLAARWILMDPPADENAFWRTRPLRWPHLLAAKFLLIVGGLVLPLFLAQAVLMTAVGAGTMWPGVLAETVRIPGGWILGAAALAALAGSWLRMLTVVLVGWVGILATFVVLDGLFSLLNLRGLGTFDLTGLILSTEAMVVSGWLVVVATVALLLQYGCRRPRWTLAAILLLGIAWIIAHPGYPPGHPAAAATAESLPDFTVGIQDDQQLWHKDQEGGLVGISAILDMEGPPPPYFVQPLWLSGSHVHFADDDVATSGQAGPLDEHHPAALRMYQSAVPGFDILNPNPMSLPGQVFITLAAYAGMQVTVVEKSLFGGPTTSWTLPGPEHYAGRQGTYRADLVFDLSRHETVADLPLEPGSSWSEGPNRIVVLGTGSHGGDRTVLSIRVQWLKGQRHRSLEPVHALLVNPDRAEAYVPVRTQSTHLLRVPPFATQDLRVSFWRRDGEGTPVSIHEDWLAGASVRVVTRRHVGQVTKPLRLENFRLWPDPDALTKITGSR